MRKKMEPAYCKAHDDKVIICAELEAIVGMSGRGYYKHIDTLDNLECYFFTIWHSEYPEVVCRLPILSIG
jgi:hypothetical protein